MMHQSVHHYPRASAEEERVDSTVLCMSVSLHRLIVGPNERKRAAVVEGGRGVMHPRDCVRRGA
jgi:hypothetical protein